MIVDTRNSFVFNKFYVKSHLSAMLYLKHELIRKLKIHNGKIDSSHLKQSVSHPLDDSVKVVSNHQSITVIEKILSKIVQ